MSKIAYLTPPEYGHVNPTLAVVHELLQRGEHVIYYNAAEFGPAIERTGATFRAYAASDLTWAKFSAVSRSGNRALAAGLILRATENLLPALLDDLEREKPDLVVYDSTALWGRMAATTLDLPAAASITHLIPDETHQTMFDAVAGGTAQSTPFDYLLMLSQFLPLVPKLIWNRRRLVRRYGNAYPSDPDGFPMRAGLNIVFAARELQPDSPVIDATFRFVGPSISPKIRLPEDPIRTSRRIPTVYVSLGTVYCGENEFYRICFEAFGDFPAHFVLSVGEQTDLRELGVIPSNFTVRPSVAQLDVLRRTDVFITHGGLNSIHEGLYYGVPLVLIPHQSEQLFNARTVAAHGAGHVIRDRVLRKPLRAATMRPALEMVLSERRYRDAAGKLQKLLRATGGYRQAADEIQALLAGSSLRVRRLAES